MGGNGDGVQLRREKVRGWYFLPSGDRIQGEEGEAAVISYLGGGPAFASDLAKCEVAFDATVLGELLMVSGVEI